MMSTPLSRPPAALVPVIVALLAGLVTACTSNATPTSSGDPQRLAVRATDTACEVSAPHAPSGALTFSITNAGSKVNEFYLLAADGLRILGEVENIGPGLTRDLVVAAVPGTYTTACKPGMVGDGIRTTFTVLDTGQGTAPVGDDAALVAQANSQYGAYVKDQTEQLLTRTEEFVKLYEAGDDDAARALYPVARTHWERVEPVAESFGDLDPKMDLREADLEAGQKWTGWHRIEKDLWPARAKGYTALTTVQRKAYGQDLLTNTRALYERTRTTTFTADQIANGAKTLLEEVAAHKVTGEEEYWSRTDLYDFQGNLDGARVGYEGLQPLLEKRDPQLSQKIGSRFGQLQTMLKAYRQGDHFVGYDHLKSDDVKRLAAGVDALSEPLSKLTAAVV